MADLPQYRKIFLRITTTRTRDERDRAITKLKIHPDKSCCVCRLLIICIQHASSSEFVIPRVQICHPASPPSFCRSERQRVFVQRITTLPKKRNKEGAHSHTHPHKSGSILAKMLSRDMFGLIKNNQEILFFRSLLLLLKVLVISTEWQI